MTAITPKIADGRLAYPLMRYAARLLLVPFWLLGFVVAVVALLVLAVGYSIRTGWSDGFDRYGGKKWVA